MYIPAGRPASAPTRGLETLVYGYLLYTYIYIYIYIYIIIMFCVIVSIMVICIHYNDTTQYNHMLSQGMGVVSNSWSDHDLLSFLYMFKP